MDILEVARRGCLASRWLKHSRRNITSLDKEGFKVTQEFRDVEVRERRLQSVVIMKPEEAAENFSEVANDLAVRENFDTRLAEALRECEDAFATARD